MVIGDQVIGNHTSQTAKQSGVILCHRESDMCWKRAFNLVELLVCMTILSLMLAIIIPALECAKEKARRTVCRSHLKSFFATIYMYAGDYNDRLPIGSSDSGEDEEHTPLVSTVIYEALVEFAEDERVFVCPGAGGPFRNGRTWKYEPYGRVLGYNYLGGHQGLPWERNDQVTADWKSPQVLSDKRRLPLITELNAWTVEGKRTWAPHGKHGPIKGFANEGMGGMTSRDAGAAGGNIALLDGSVEWKSIEKMDIYQGSRNHTIDGCVSYW